MGVFPTATTPKTDAIVPLDWTLTPGQALARWPDELALAALISAGDGDTSHPWGRWSILATPERSVRLGPDDGAPSAPLEAMRAALSMPKRAGAGRADSEIISEIPFRSGWIGVLSYELGGLLEPAARQRHAGHASPSAWPACQWHRCPGALVHDGARGRWFAAGDTRALPDLSIERRADDRFRVGPARSDRGRAAFEADVARVIEYIRAGDVFQVNLAHEVRAPFEGSTRAMFRAMLGAASPWYGAYVESAGGEDTGGGAAGRAVCSISPELFLAFDPRTRRVTTRPIKGTRRGDAPSAELIASEKDGAELVMIVDLMRNDLGRVCRPGSVRVSEARRIERHGGRAGAIQHGVATVEGELRDGLDAIDLIGAAFPAGSITGAPKVRAMQIIDELERRPRGPYCGSIGYIDDRGGMALSVAIRTAGVVGEPLGAGGRTRGVVAYGAGAGIVADSDPASEWRETLEKARGFLRAVGSSFEA